MRLPFLAAAFTVLTLPALAQGAAPVLYASPADVAAAEARARALPGMVPQVLVGGTAPYRSVLEYRAKPTPASVHEQDDELIAVVNGSGTLIVGGALKEETRRNATNRSGTGIEGGASHALVKGAWLYIPAGTAHYFASMGSDGLTIVSVHMPHAAP